MDILNTLRRNAEHLTRDVTRTLQQAPAAVQQAAQTVLAPLVGGRPQDHFDGVQRGASSRTRPPALPAAPRPSTTQPRTSAAHPTATTRPSTHATTRATTRPATQPSTPNPLQAVASWGRGLSEAGRNLDGFFVSQMNRSEAMLGHHDLARAGSGFGHAVTEMVTGSMELVGGALQLADPRQRQAAAQTLNTIARDPGAAATAVRDQVVQAWQRDPARFTGAVVGNLVPVGAALNAVSRTGRVAQSASTVGRVARGLASHADDVAAAARGTTRAAAAAHAFPALRSGSEYAALVARQTAEGSVDLTNLARPGIAHFDPQSGAYGIIQGAGRAEKARPDQMLDLFLERGTPLPPGAIRAETDVAGSLVADANTLSSRGAAGANPDLVQFTTQGKVYDRVFVPRHAVDVPTSKLGYDVRQGRAALEKNLGADEARATLAAHHFDELAIVEQHALLKGMGVIE